MSFLDHVVLYMLLFECRGSTFNFNFDYAYSWRHPFSIWTTQTNLDTYSKPDYVTGLINKLTKI